MAKRGSYILDMPVGLNGRFMNYLHGLIVLSRAFPYDVDGVARVGVKYDETENVLPSLMDLRGRGIEESRGTYTGSKVILELLRSTPRVLAYNGSQLVRAVDWPPEARRLGEPIGNVLQGSGETPYVDCLIMAYARAIHSLGKPEAEQIPQCDLKAMIYNLSPTLGSPVVEKKDLLLHTAMCLQFVQSVLMLRSVSPDLAAAGLERLLAFSRFFQRDPIACELDESLRIDATILEMLAEVIEIRPGLSRILGYIYPRSLRTDAAHRWATYLEKHPGCGEFDGIYDRALNIAHLEPDHALLERLFRLQLSRRGDFLHHIRFNIRTAWAVLYNEPARRSEPEMWDEFSHHIFIAKRQLACWGHVSAYQIADVAGRVLESARYEARTREPGWQHLN